MGKPILKNIDLGAGLAQGQAMTIVVRGSKICSYCEHNLLQMEDRSGLSSLTIADEGNSSVMLWVSGSDAWTVIKTPILVKQ